ncbi:hypothetical protein P691DRAFT_707235 [Macrolepiota fuliginosa MF-IS2]|uniref:DUF6593 domain-containing protein n=1 Tax=Macrolepiota fuliginosa MF-IS2 TaxID=1400762 RepID=A0A9P5XCQ6_9AGAR|nr:hypothetical protein P691DRAFT_707235 [Macrolepiota fuliginosa MF-IS2]
MRLILSHRSRNSTYSTETGEVLYKVNTPRQFPGPGVTTIRKAVDTINGVWLGDSEQSNPRAKPTFYKRKLLVSDKGKDDSSIDGGRPVELDVDDAVVVSDSEHEDQTLRSSASEIPVHEGHFAFCAQIDFRTFQPTRFQYDGHDVPVSQYFHRSWSWRGRDRVFKASDGKEYRWELRARRLEMIRDDGSKERVVRYKRYRPALGPVLKGRPAILEVDPSCEPILDEIMMTFIYCYKLWKDRQ